MYASDTLSSKKDWEYFSEILMYLPASTFPLI
jgi:hypothetical protein